MAPVKKIHIKTRIPVSACDMNNTAARKTVGFGETPEILDKRM
jgi:hypothetical protein